MRIKNIQLTRKWLKADPILLLNNQRVTLLFCNGNGRFLFFLEIYKKKITAKYCPGPGDRNASEYEGVMEYMHLRYTFSTTFYLHFILGVYACSQCTFVSSLVTVVHFIQDSFYCSACMQLNARSG
jgi:hypothetical protein